jgi:hypothetical protein
MNWFVSARVTGSTEPRKKQALGETRNENGACQKVYNAIFGFWFSQRYCHVLHGPPRRGVLYLPMLCSSGRTLRYLPVLIEWRRRRVDAAREPNFSRHFLHDCRNRSYDHSFDGGDARMRPRRKTGIVDERVSGSGRAYGREIKNAPGGQRNSLKRLDSDKKIQGNPSFFSWICLARALPGLAAFG